MDVLPKRLLHGLAVFGVLATAPFLAAAYTPDNHQLSIAEGGQVALGSIAPAPGERSADARDTMWAFEGGTGDKGEAGQPASQSLMGFILLRDKAEGGYDVHIAFRGSRSGLAGRAIIEALSDSGASGNPDWITGLGSGPIN